MISVSLDGSMYGRFRVWQCTASPTTGRWHVAHSPTAVGSISCHHYPGLKAGNPRLVRPRQADLDMYFGSATIMVWGFCPRQRATDFTRRSVDISSYICPLTIDAMVHRIILLFQRRLDSATTAGVLAISPPAPPAPKAVSSRYTTKSRCRAFSGKGFTLGIRTVALQTDTDQSGASILDNNEQSTELDNSGNTAGRGEVATTLNVAHVAPSVKKATHKENHNGVVLDEGSTFCDWSSPTAGPEEANTVGNTCSPSDNGVDPRCPRAVIEITCKSCGKLVPPANYALHQFRCRGFRPGVLEIGRRSVATTAVTIDTPVEDSTPSTIVRGSTDAIATAAAVARKSVNTSDRSNCPIGNVTGVDETAAERKVFGSEGAVKCRDDSGMGGPSPPPSSQKSVREQNDQKSPLNPPPGVSSPNGSTSVSPNPSLFSPRSLLSCVYCGLSFRDLHAAGDHRELCGARTERCDRCFQLVPRRDVAGAHRLPGGACDAAIAAAVAVEGKVCSAATATAMTTGVAATVGEEEGRRLAVWGDSVGREDNTG